MLPITFLFLLAQVLFQYPQQAGYRLDEAVLELMQQQAEFLNQQMTQLLLELEQMKLEQSSEAWGAPLVWQFSALTGILILLLALRFGLKKIRCYPGNSGHKERSISNFVEEKEEGHKRAAKEDIESNYGNVEEDNKDGKEEGSSVDAKTESSVGREAKEGYDDAIIDDEEVEEVNAAGNGEEKGDANKEDNDHSIKGNLGRLSEVCLQLPVLDLDKGCSVITDLMDKLIGIFGEVMSDSFYPVPQPAIRVGSAFECWSSRTQDVVYRMLVPLSPPPGHAFHLELDSEGILQRKFCVRVELLCTCVRERLGEDMLCFLHHPKEELKSKQDPSLLHTLCTGSYLDVEKTVRWFYRFMRIAWMVLPESHHWHLMLQPCSRSCKFHLSKDKESFEAEVIFGVQQGDSDIFVESQAAEVGIPSTTWLETYDVVEAKFFRDISRQVLLEQLALQVSETPQEHPDEWRFFPAVHSRLW